MGMRPLKRRASQPDTRAGPSKLDHAAGCSVAIAVWEAFPSVPF